MSSSIFSIKTFCVFLLLVSFVMFLGCTTTPSGSTGPLQTTSSPLSSPTPTTSPVSGSVGQSTPVIQLDGNAYGLASSPAAGIDAITFSIKPVSGAPAVDLTGMKIIFSTPDTDPVTLTYGTLDSTHYFTTSAGNYPITSMNAADHVLITFRVALVQANSNINIELDPSAGSPLILTKTAPALIASTNVLD